MLCTSVERTPSATRPRRSRPARRPWTRCSSTRATSAAGCLPRASCCAASWPRTSPRTARCPAPAPRVRGARLRAPADGLTQPARTGSPAPRSSMPARRRRARRAAQCGLVSPGGAGHTARGAARPRNQRGVVAAHDVPPCCLPWMPHAHGKPLSSGQAAEHRPVSPSSPARRRRHARARRGAWRGGGGVRGVQGAPAGRDRGRGAAGQLPGPAAQRAGRAARGRRDDWQVGCGLCCACVCGVGRRGGGGVVGSAVWACCLRAGGAMLARRHCWPGIPELICAEQTQTCRPMLCNTWRHLHSMEHSDVTCCAARACAECKWAPSGARRGAWPPQMRARAAAGAGAWWRTRAGAACSSCAPRPTAPSWIRSTCARLVRRPHWLTDCRAALRECCETGARACRCKSCRAPGRGCFMASSQAGQWTACDGS